jgi:IPT/TIG domain
MLRSLQSAARAIALILFAVSTATAQSPMIGSCPVLPADSVWNTPVDQLPVSANSSVWGAIIGSTKTLHPDFGSGLYNGAPIGIPFITVPGAQAKFPASFTYASESDPGPYAIPLNAPIEGGSQSTGDRHTLAIDTDHCILYELYAAYPQAASWTAGSGAIFNLFSNALRPSGWTSTDAAGLPIFPGLVRYDEVAAGEIRHAIRFTVPQTQRAFVWPARHFASSLTGTQYPPMGARFRLRAGFDISGFSAANQVILRALKRYGMMVADNGSSWYLSGAPDSRWDNDDLHNLGLVKGSDFEVVDVSGLMTDPNSGQAKQSTIVTVTVSPSTASVPVNTTKQFIATVTGAGTQIVNWSVSGAPGGNSTVGVIGASGLYTAPAAPPSGGTVDVQAASAVSPSAVGTAIVTITAQSIAPVLSSITPNSGTRGTSVPVTLTGSNFQPGATVAVGGEGVSPTNVTVAGSTRITATFTIGGRSATGAHSVTVTTSAGTTAAQTFTVTAPASGRGRFREHR